LTDELRFKFSSGCCGPIPGELDAGGACDAAFLIIDVSLQHNGTRPAVPYGYCNIISEGIKGTRGRFD
jgi:hypothetical protein